MGFCERDFRTLTLNRPDVLNAFNEELYHATALALHHQGQDDAIAEQLGIAPEAVPVLLELAAAKLARLISREERRALPSPDEPAPN